MGGVVTTARDLVTWHRTLQGDNVLDAASKAILYRPVMGGYACGWRVGTSDRGTAFVAHDGSVEGYSCHYARYLDEDVVIVILSNGKSDLFTVQRAIDDALFQKPTNTVTLDAARLELDELQAVRVTSPGWRVRRFGDIVEMELVHPDDNKTLAIVKFPNGVSVKLAADLDQMLAGRAEDGEMVSAMDVGVYFAALGKVRTKTLTGTEIRLMPRYPGRDPNGRPVTDPRITLAVVDPERSFWPVLTKMNLKAATGLRDALRP
jgi:hypothetical protein